MAVQWLLLAVRVATDTNRNDTRPFWCDTDKPAQYVLLVNCRDGYRFCQRFWTNARGARAVGCRRGAKLPRKFKGHGLLVSPQGAGACDSDFRCWRQVRQRDRRAAGGADRCDIRLALGVRYHWPAELSVFPGFSTGLS